MSDFNDAIIAEFRANNGQVKMFAGSTVLLLTTTGAKSGQSRTSPVVTIENDNGWLIIASKGGAPTNPDWYHNLVANPIVTVEVPNTEPFQAKATPVADPAERDNLYAKMVAVNPGFAEYQQKTTRTIPVVTLERI